MPHPLTAALPLAILLLVAGLTVPRGARDPAVAHPRGVRTVALENPQLRIRVPTDSAMAVWDWLQRRYLEPSFLNSGGREFTAASDVQNRIDVWFDDRELTLLANESGLRLRREAPDGAPGAETVALQLRWTRPSAEHRRGVEADFAIDAATTSRRHAPLLAHLAGEQRAVARRCMTELGIDPQTLAPVLTVQQVRHRILLRDQDGPFATVAMTRCSCRQSDCKLEWYEFDSELDALRFGPADDAARAAMLATATRIELDLRAQFPDLEPETTLAYVRAFREVEAASWLPLRSLRA
jgi:hypothetical protein